MEDRQRASDIVPHQDLVEDVVENVLEDASTQIAIADLSAASGTYVQAEATATRTALNKVLQVLRDAGLIPST